MENAIGIAEAAEVLRAWFWLGVIAVHAICAASCSWLAKEKGYSEGAGFFTGALLGLLMLVVWAGAPDRKGRGDG